MPKIKKNKIEQIFIYRDLKYQLFSGFFSYFIFPSIFMNNFKCEMMVPTVTTCKLKMFEYIFSNHLLPIKSNLA